MSSNIFSQPPTPTPTPTPDDAVSYSIYPPPTPPPTPASLHTLHLQILTSISPFTTSYIYQHHPFTLTPTPYPHPTPHLHGSLRFGDSLDDEWFVVFLLFHISRTFPHLSITVHDSDGDFLLIESAFHLPRWVNPDVASNRVFIRDYRVCIIPISDFKDAPLLSDAIEYLNNVPVERYAAPEAVQKAILSKVEEFPERGARNVHRVRVRVPVQVAQVLKMEPCLVSLAVEGFYDRDVDGMKMIGAGMARFVPSGSSEELVRVSVRMSRAMYAQLVQQTFQAPKGYPPLPPRSDVEAYKEAELGVKISCGFEMMYQLRKREGDEGTGSTWEAFRKSMERNGYFKGLLPGSEEYKRLMKNVEGYYRDSSVHYRASDTLNAPVRRTDEILAQPHSTEDFIHQDLPLSDSDSWLYDGEDELNAALQERQKEMELYDAKHKKKQKSKEQEDEGPSATKNLDEYNLEEVAKSMQAFVKKISSYEGAEVPEDGNLKDVDFDVDRFMKDMESVMGRQASKDGDSDDDIEDELSSDMDFDASEDESDIEDNEGGEDDFMHAYSDVLNRELKDTTLGGSFVRANEKPLNKDDGTSNAEEDTEEFTPVDVDLNLVKSLLDSFSSQQGLPGPASNLLGLMGLQLPPDSSKGK